MLEAADIAAKAHVGRASHEAPAGEPWREVLDSLAPPAQLVLALGATVVATSGGLRGG